jgi:hypothetical protein
MPSGFELGAWLTNDVVIGRFDRNKIAKTETNGSKIETSEPPMQLKAKLSGRKQKL